MHLCMYTFYLDRMYMTYAMVRASSSLLCAELSKFQGSYRAPYPLDGGDEESEVTA